MGLLTPAMAQQSFLYPRPPIEADARSAYALKMIRLALAKTAQDFGDAEVHYSPHPLERSEAEQALATGAVDLYMLPGDNTYDARYIHIPIPIDRGLLGTRVGFIHREDRNLLNAVRRLEDLKAHSICSGTHWRISKTLDFNGLAVHHEARYEDLFKALNARDCTYFTRGIAETLPELGHWSERYPDLALEPYVYLKTPLAFYLYTSTNNRTLARRLEIGLWRAFEDGSFQRAFMEEFDVILRTIRLSTRQSLTLKSPEPHKNAPSRYSSFWYKNFVD